jgi:hypothetical protein
MVSYALASGSSRFNMQDRPELMPGLSNQLSGNENRPPRRRPRDVNHGRSRSFLSCRGIKALVVERIGVACAASGKRGLSGSRLVRWNSASTACPP